MMNLIKDLALVLVIWIVIMLAFVGFLSLFVVDCK